MATTTSIIDVPNNKEAVTAMQPYDRTKPPSAISELQEAFGSILLARREKDDIIPKFDQPPPSALYKWTGLFDLFSFPRELRDRIYYHYLYRPKGVLYKRNATLQFPFDQSDDIVSLFLTSRQVYEEALQIFCRHNVIDFTCENWCRSIRGTLSLFPDKHAAAMIQRVTNTYVESRIWDPVYVMPGARGVFMRMLRDAWMFKRFFPKLREFKAAWRFYDESVFEGRTEEEKIGIWLEWMRKSIKPVRDVIPMMGLRIEFVDEWNRNLMKPHEESVNRAYMRLLRDTDSWADNAAQYECMRTCWISD